uniref:Jumping translocation breakpoint protein n=1 Tax=Capitella teleta TaxID=283909 RepID=X1ZC31_CAPTE
MNRDGLCFLLLRIMIEFCTKKRMILAVAFMLGVSVIVLLIENNLPLALKDITEAFGKGNTTNKQCWQETDHEIIGECAPCNSFDLEALEICKETGYKELIKCSYSNGTNKEVNRRCPKHSWVEQRSFYMFEALAFVVGCAAYSVVGIRQKRLEKMLLEKVHKQIAAGV